MEKTTYYTKDSDFEIRNPMELQNSDYFTNIAVIVRDGLKVLIDYLKENCKSIDPQKIIKSELEKSDLKPTTPEILEQKENDVMYLLKWMNFYKNQIIGFFDMEYTKDSYGNKRNDFYDSIDEILKNRNAFAHQNEKVLSLSLQKKTVTKKSENIILVFKASISIFSFLCSKNLKNLLEFTLKNLRRLKNQFLAHLSYKRERKAISRMTTEEIETKKSIELGLARKNKERFQKEVNSSELIKEIASLKEKIYENEKLFEIHYERKIQEIKEEQEEAHMNFLKMLADEKDCEISKLQKRIESRQIYFDREIESLKEIIEKKNYEISVLEERIKKNCKISIDDLNKKNQEIERHKFFFNEKIKNLESDLDFYKRRSDNFKSEYETSKCQHELAIFAFQLLHKEHIELEQKLGSKQSFLSKFCKSPAVIALKKYLSE